MSDRTHITRTELVDALPRRDFTIDELVGRTEALLRVLAPRQTRYKVTDRPDIRTIRYYTSQSLLPKPVGYSGGRARYAGSHLVRLLLIKKLQSEHHTLRQIARKLADTDDHQIIDMLCPAPTMQAQVTDIQSLESTADAPGLARTVIQRIEIAPGCHLDVAGDALADASQRRHIADALQALAARLREL